MTERQLASFICPRCGAVSFNPNDIRERYCGRCHRFADRGARCAACGAGQDFGRIRCLACGEPLVFPVDPYDPYCDVSFEARACDHCGRAYRGPAVYCSLACALEDA